MTYTWLVVAVLVTNILWGGLFVYFYFFKDRGHFLFGVQSLEAQRALEELLSDCCAKKTFVTIELGAIDTPPLSMQSVMNDRLMVLHRYRTDIGKQVLATGPAIPVDDPLACAKRAVEILRTHGFDAEAYEFPIEVFPKGFFAVVRSNAFEHWNLIFRRHGPHLCRTLRGTFLHIHLS